METVKPTKMPQNNMACSAPRSAAKTFSFECAMGSIPGRIHHQPIGSYGLAAVSSGLRSQLQKLQSCKRKQNEKKSGELLSLFLARSCLGQVRGGAPFSQRSELATACFFWLGAAWVKSRAERPSVSGVNRQLHVQIGCKLGIGNRKDELTKQAKRNKLRIKPGGN